MSRPLFRCAAVLVLLCSGIVTVARFLAPTLDGDILAFVSDRDLNDDIFLLDLRRGALKNLTHHPAYDTAPDWSPDGTRLVFHSDRDNDAEIYVIDATGENLRQLTFNETYDGLPDWSPDGETIAFISTRDNTYDLYVMKTNGSDVRRLTATNIDDLFPTWSPDSSTVAVAAGGVCMVFFDVIPGLLDSTRCLGGLGYVRDLAWSPDGAWIAAAAPQQANFDLYLIDTETGRDVRRLIQDHASDLSPAWSIDGRSLVFESDRAGSYDLYTLDIASGRLNRLTDHPADDGFPVWRP